MRKLFADKRLWVFCVAAIVACAVFAGMVGIAVENYWMIRAFDPDESTVLAEIQKMYNHNLWAPLNFNYGSAHAYISLVLLNLLGFFREINFEVIAWVARSVNFLALLGIGALFCWQAGREMRSRWLLLFCAILFFSELSFRYALNSKPEHLQAFFLMASLFLFRSCLGGLRVGYLLLSGVFAGFAFATKYAGALLLVFLTGYLLVVSLVEKRGWRKFAVGLFYLYGGALVGTLMLGPYLIIKFPVVELVLTRHSRSLTSGYLFLGEGSKLAWFENMLSAEVLWWGLALWLIPGAWLLFRGRQAWREGWPRRGVVGAWALFYSSYLLVMVKEPIGRYLIIVMPCWYYLLCRSVDMLESYLENTGRNNFAGVMRGAVLLGLFFTLFPTVNIGREIYNKPISPRIAAGDWLAENISPFVPIASDLYTYIPPTFARHYHKPYLSINDIAMQSPEAIVVSRDIMSRYLEENGGRYYRDGEIVYSQHYQLYSRLRSNHFPGYSLEKDYGDVLIFRKNKAAS